MDMPQWWEQRRVGVLVHASLAAVPAWSPIGASAGRYRAHLGEGAAGGAEHGRPLVEVLAHHRDRWGHIGRYDDFLPLLSFDGFDADAWADLAVAAGAGYAAVVARPDDGWAWWDAPGAAPTMTTDGPCRNIVGDFAAACGRRDLVVGVAYTAAGSRGRDAATDLGDLVDRYGVRVLRVDPDSDQLPAAAADRLRAEHPEVVVVGPAGGVRAFEWSAPRGIRADPWELRRSVGAGDGFNRTERPEHHLSGADIVALVCEVVAKGGHLLLTVGAAADGTIPEVQARPLREAGAWIRRHERLVDGGVPWATWGDADVRCIDVDGELHVVDVADRGRIAVLGLDRHPVARVERDGRPVEFHQDRDGVQLELHRGPGRPGGPRRAGDIAVYRVVLVERDEPVALFPPAARAPVALDPLLRGVGPGDTVQLGDGVYAAPAVLPAGVTLRGLGGSRTIIDCGADGAISLAAGARLEYVGVERVGLDDDPADGVSASAVVRISGDGGAIVGCRIDGPIAVAADGASVRATNAASVTVEGSDRVAISRCQLAGRPGDTGVEIIGGDGHVVESSEIHGHGCAIRLTATTAVSVRGNNLSARWWGVHVERCEHVHVHANFVDRTMRGIDVHGGGAVTIDGNAVRDGDSGCVLAWGAMGCEVSGNTWERCRIGVLTWAIDEARVRQNEAIDLHEPDGAYTAGP